MALSTSTLLEDEIRNLDHKIQELTRLRAEKLEVLNRRRAVETDMRNSVLVPDSPVKERPQQVRKTANKSASASSNCTPSID